MQGAGTNSRFGQGPGLGRTKAERTNTERTNTERTEPERLHFGLDFYLDSPLRHGTMREGTR